MFIVFVKFAVNVEAAVELAASPVTLALSTTDHVNCVPAGTVVPVGVTLKAFPEQTDAVWLEYTGTGFTVYV